MTSVCSTAAGTAARPRREPRTLIRPWRWQAHGAPFADTPRCPAAKAGQAAGHQSLITGGVDWRSAAMISPSRPAGLSRSTADSWSRTTSSGTPGRSLISTYRHRIDSGLPPATGFPPGPAAARRTAAIAETTERPNSHSQKSR
jgi:hypothetical protein